MARPTRIVLDMALVSLEKAVPAVSKAWGTTKSFVMDTPAKPILCNRYVNRLETALHSITGSLWMKLKTLRDKQLPAECEYLEKELEKVRKKLEGDKKPKPLKSAAKNVKSIGATTWRYLKVEAIPPLTGNFFNGPVGQKLENMVERTTNGFIGIIAGRIKEIDAEAEREKLEKAAAMKALEEKLKADAKRKKEESLKAAAAKAAEEAKKAKAAADAKKAQEKPEAKPDTKPGTKGGTKSEKKVKKSKKPKRTKKGPRTSPSDKSRKKKPK